MNDLRNMDRPINVRIMARLNNRISFLLVIACVAFSGITGSARAQSVTPSREEIIEYTAEWEGERYPSGRPMVPDDILERMENVSIEQAWGVLEAAGYRNQFAGGWEMIHTDQPVIGRALTTTYTPDRPGLHERMRQQGHEAGHVGAMNSWPIDMLQQGDVYVADAYGKIDGGTLIGDNLGNAIHANSGNGVVFDGSARDLGGLEEIEGFNAFVREFHPSIIEEMMLLSINAPARIGQVTVLPGDVVLARREGVIFIPSHLAEQVVEEAEIVMLQDMFGHQRLREGAYTPGQIDGEWSQDIRDDFYRWLEENRDDVPVPDDVIDQMLSEQDL